MEGWRGISIPPVGVETRCSKQQNSSLISFFFSFSSCMTISVLLWVSALSFRGRKKKREEALRCMMYDYGPVQTGRAVSLECSLHVSGAWDRMMERWNGPLCMIWRYQPGV